MRIAIVAGETSGDLLAADLLQALRVRWPDIRAEGVTGPALREAGCETLEDMQALSVMGIAEVLGDLPRLLRLRKRLFNRWKSDPPDLLIGIDAPDFNLGLERRLKALGVKTVHYVSPTVWAWRPGRVHKIARSADLLLCLFPFEPACYVDTPVKAHFVGHPFARQIEQVPDKAACRQAFALEQDVPVLALLPGSRRGEIRQLGETLLAALEELLRRQPHVQILVPVANARVREALLPLLAKTPGLERAVRLIDGRMRELVRAADAAIVTSGTATLETMLLGTPFVVAYKASPFTEWLLRGLGLLRIQHVALPNILAGREVALELLQQDAHPSNLAAAAYRLLNQPALAQAQRDVFLPLARQLDQPSGELGAAAIAELCSAE